MKRFVDNHTTEIATLFGLIGIGLVGFGIGHGISAEAGMAVSGFMLCLWAIGLVA